MTIVSETQALSLRCCGGPGTGKVMPHEPLQRSCVGPKCMAWREANLDTIFPTGYCGLAGKPEESE